jgi:hypothetical protein
MHYLFQIADIRTSTGAFPRTLQRRPKRDPLRGGIEIHRAA